MQRREDLTRRSAHEREAHHVRSRQAHEAARAAGSAHRRPRATSRSAKAPARWARSLRRARAPCPVLSRSSLGGAALNSGRVDLRTRARRRRDEMASCSEPARRPGPRAGLPTPRRSRSTHSAIAPAAGRSLNLAAERPTPLHPLPGVALQARRAPDVGCLSAHGAPFRIEIIAATLAAAMSVAGQIASSLFR